MPRSSSSIDKFLRDYKHDIFVMLIALGIERTHAAALIDQYSDDIKALAGDCPSKGPIVTPQMTARLIVRTFDHRLSGL